MKKQLFALFTFLIITIVFALSIYGADAAVSQNYINQDFTALSVASGMRLKVTQSEKYAVTVLTKESQLKLVRVEQIGKTLKFYLSPFTITSTPIEILIAMPELTKLDLSGGSRADMTMDVTDKAFSADISGGSRLAGSLQAQRLELDLSGGSRSSLTGEADEMKAKASGGSKVEQENFRVNKAGLDLSGGSKVYIYVQEMMEVDASGGSQVYFRGTPKLGKTSFSGGSGIHSQE